MDYDYLKCVIEDGITDALTSEDVAEAITEISCTVADEYLADHPDPDYPDRYSIGHSLHLICDSNADIAKSLRIMSGRSDCKVDVEEFNRRYEEEKSYFREYAAIIRNALDMHDTSYEKGVLHGLSLGLSLIKWTYDQLNSNVSDKDKYHVESKEI